MSKKKEQPIDLQKVPEEEKLKYEIAEELGLLDKVLKPAGKVCPPRKQVALADL